MPRHEGKKGSQKKVKWNEKALQAFVDVKKALTQELELFQMDPSKPFILRTDASRYAIGAVLSQIFDGEERPVAFHSRKLTASQRNWTPREQETYAIIMALKKWSGWIGLQPVTVLTDHRDLEYWVTEHVDTLSGPAG